jgi:RNA polymerase-binding transcription factor DksA
VAAKKKNVKKTVKKPVKKTATKKSAPAKVKKKPARKGKKIAEATAASILGIATPNNSAKAKTVRPNSNVKIKAGWKKYYDILLDLRGHLMNQMGDLKKESAEEMTGYSMHMADSGTDNFDRDSALSLLSSDQDAVYEIDEALKRIEEGTYGRCELTDKAIPKTRLNAVPWARYTVDSQAQLEKDGAVRHRKLGSLGTIDGAGTSKVAIADNVDSGTKPAKKES